MYCPHCENGNAELIETEVENAWDGKFDGVAIECLDCGARGMSAKQSDEGHDQIAINLWMEDDKTIKLLQNHCQSLSQALILTMPWVIAADEEKGAVVVCKHCDNEYGGPRKNPEHTIFNLKNDDYLDYHKVNCAWKMAWTNVYQK